MPDIDFNEEEILNRAAQGEREAFGLLYERYIDRIFNYVYYRTGNLHDAEDLTARVFQRAMNHIKNYTDRGVPFSAWLYRIAHNLAVDYLRKRQPDSSPEMDDQHGGGGHVEDMVAHRQQMTDLVSAVQQLDDSEQDVVILRFVQGYSHDEVSAMIGKSATEKVSFFGATPIVQPAITAVGTTTATTALNETKINRLYAALRTIGLINTGG